MMIAADKRWLMQGGQDGAWGEEEEDRGWRGGGRRVDSRYPAHTDREAQHRTGTRRAGRRGMERG